MPESRESEEARMRMTAVLNRVAGEREELEIAHGQVWDTQQLRDDFIVHSFLAPFVSVTRKSDGRKGMLLFQHVPRYYFEFVTDDPDESND